MIAFRSCEVHDGYLRSLLRVSRPDGSRLRVVRAFPAIGTPECVYGKADWSWDGRRLLGEGPFLETMTPRGRLVRQLHLPFESSSWAPGRGGVTTTRATSRPHAIWQHRLDGGRPRRVTPRWPDVGWHECSRDGRTLAYERLVSQRGIAEIRLVDRGRRRDRRLVAGRLPRWSPNGRRIAYQQDNDVWTARRDGRGRRRLIDNDPDGAVAGWHDWSPDGRWLVSRGVAPQGDPFDPQLQLRFVRSDGRRERRLTLPAQVEYATPLSWQPRRP